MTSPAVTQIRVDHDWTTGRGFDARARRPAVVIDLRSPHIAEGDIELDLRRAHRTGTMPTVDDPTRTQPA